MIDKILTVINKLLQKRHNDLERFIVGKNPSNAAEVDYWVRMYENRNNREFKL